jgi:Zn-dependent metalloprotease
MFKSKMLAMSMLLIMIFITVVGQQKTQIDIRFPERLDKAMKGVIPDATVQEDLNTDQLRRIRGKIVVAGAASEKDAADKFIVANEALLLRSNATTQDQVKALTDITDLRPIKEVETLSGKLIVYERMYQGLPVLDDQLMILVDKANRITTLNSNLSLITDTVPIALPQDSSAAIAAAIDAVAAKSEPIDTAVQQAVVVSRAASKATPIGAWKVTFKTRAPAAAWRVLVEGNTNKVLSKNNVAQYAEGSGMVFAPNPIQASGDNTLTDNVGGSDDADDPRLTSARMLVTLHDLDENTGFLQGKYASTILSASRANQASRVYDFTRNNPHFEEVMAYYWITENQRYIQSLGFTNVNNRRVDIDVHFTDEDNSFYDPESKTLQFGNGGVDDAEDAEVILHELGHAIQDNQVPGFGGNIRHTEARAMGEGFGDYWSASFFASMGPRLDLWNVFWDKWDALAFHAAKGDDPPFLRRLDSKKHYPEDWATDEHADGEIWSACLWKIRERLGRKRADTLILASHFRLNGVTRTFEEGAKAILAEHEAREKGLPGFDGDRNSIKKIFTHRGILK